MLVVEPVQAAIWHCLNHYAYHDATFLAERLLDEADTDESIFLAATCHYRAGRVEQAHHLLQTRGARSPTSRFLLARCAADLKKDNEVETILRGPGAEVRKEVKVEDMEKRFGDRAAFALQILSSLYARTERATKAADADRKALKLNPLLWKSFESLSLAGEKVDVETVWDTSSMEELAHTTGTNPIMNLVNAATTAASAAQQNSNSGNRQQQHQAETPVGGGQIQNSIAVTPVNSLVTPVLGNNKGALHTPSPAPAGRPTIHLNDSSLSSSTVATPGQVGGGMETPLLHCNSIAFTPNHQPSPMGPPLSGISSLNITADTSSECPNIPQYKMPYLQPPPLKPKAKRLPTRGHHAPIRAFSPTFGNLGETPSPAGVAAKLLEFSSPQVVLLSASSPVLPSSMKPPLVSTPGHNNVPAGLNTPGLQSTPAAPNPLPLRTSTPGVPPPTEPVEPRPIKRVAMAAKPDNTKPNVVLTPTQTLANMITPSPVGQPRRSSRLFGSTNTTTKENSKGPGKGRIKKKSSLIKDQKQLSENELNEKNRLSDGGKVEKEKLELEPVDKPCKPENPVNLPAEGEKLQRASLRGLLTLLKQLGAAYLRVGQYDCKEAARLLQLLPQRHAESSWVLATLGKCYFEMNEYKEACRYFALVREKDPFRLEMMEYYSTALWHLQEEVELSALAQDLVRLDKMSAAAWCAGGNCYSHQKEHENAIKFFQRAVQVSPNFAYAYTLLGHEYVLVEELEKALACFRTSVRLDRRHYNAWYGIGLTYYKQERFQLAEIYYRRALAISPNSPILMCHVAVVQHATNNTPAAIETLTSALKISPKNALCKFQRASILHSCDRNQEALEELLELKEIVPKESPVYFLIGKVHNKLNNTHLALMHYSWAMDLDPKGANSQVKDALDPALNRVGQELGLSVEEEDREEPMVSDADHHEDFQGEISEGFQPGAAEENLHSFDSVPEVVGGLRSQGTQDSDDSL